MTLDRLTTVQQTYLETVHGLDRGTGARLLDVATRLRVKPPSALEALARLREMGLVVHQPRDTVSLTATGRRLAAQLERRHSTIRRFLTRILRLPRAKADQDACRIEHALGTGTVARLGAFVEHADTDALEHDDTVPLTLMNKGERGVLVRVTRGHGHTARLAAMGMHPGIALEVLQPARSGPVMVRAGRTRLAIGRELATALHVRPDSIKETP